MGETQGAFKSLWPHARLGEGSGSEGFHSPTARSLGSGGSRRPLG